MSDGIDLMIAVFINVICCLFALTHVLNQVYFANICTGGSHLMKPDADLYVKWGDVVTNE